MEQKSYWALLGHTLANGKIGDVEIIKVTETEGYEHDANKTFYTTYNDFDNKLISDDVKGIVEQLREIEKNILYYGVKFIVPSKQHINNLVELEKINKT